MKLYKHKKGLEIGWSIIVKAIFVLIALFLAIILIRTFTSTGLETIEGFRLF